MPEQAIKEIKKDIYLMLHKCVEMLNLSADAFVKNTPSKLAEAIEISKEIHAKEDALTAALAKMGSSHAEARTILAVPAYIEKIAVSIESIIDHTRQKAKEDILFNDKAIQDAKLLFTATQDVLKKTADITVKSSTTAADGIMRESDKIVRMSLDFATAHENRLISGEASPKSSSVFLFILYTIEDLVWFAKEIVRKMTGK